MKHDKKPNNFPSGDSDVDIGPTILVGPRNAVEDETAATLVKQTPGAQPLGFDAEAPDSSRRDSPDIVASGGDLAGSDRAGDHGGARASGDGPTLREDRLETLDVLRGFAVLGILVMNIQSFAMIGAAYLNPTVGNGLEGVNYHVWYFSHLLADTKFMSIFSMLFGAGIVLMAQRRQDRGRSAWKLHYRRMVGLLLIGIVHSYVFWHGDILVPYAVCGSILFPLWRLPLRWLLSCSAMLFFIGAAMILMFDWSMSFLTGDDLVSVMESWKPTAEQIRVELEAYQGPWPTQVAYRIESTLMMQLFVIPTMIGWQIGGLMLLGMALHKSGVFSGIHSSRSLALMMLAGFGIGFPVIAWGIDANEKAGWTLQESMFSGSLPNYFGSIFASLGYVAMIGWMMKGTPAKVLTWVLAPVGRMALTNYLMQTVVCTTIFYGHGFGLFAKLQRTEQLAIVLSIWVVQIAISNVWMRNFRYGPIEYLWRVATYGRLETIRT